jgi:hypothetical protein
MTLIDARSGTYPDSSLPAIAFFPSIITGSATNGVTITVLLTYHICFFDIAVPAVSTVSNLWPDPDKIKTKFKTALLSDQDLLDSQANSEDQEEDPEAEDESKSFVDIKDSQIISQPRTFAGDDEICIVKKETRFVKIGDTPKKSIKSGNATRKSGILNPKSEPFRK